MEMLVDQRLRGLAAATAAQADAELLAELVHVVDASGDGLAHLGVPDGLADANIHDAANINASRSCLQQRMRISSF